jgi:hypothetical protein
MVNVSLIIDIAFIFITLITVFLFFRATGNSKKFLIIVSIWMLIQLILGLTHFYSIVFTTPPRFIFLIVPPLIFTIYLFLTIKGKAFIDTFDLKYLTIIHTVRIVVEIVLYFLFIAKTIPQLMTFEGRNFDILAGFTAPLLYYFCFIKSNSSKKILLFWNIACIVLLLNIVILAIFSSETPFQKFAFDQPNIAIAHFPYNWLASVIVPLVLFSHLASIRLLLKHNTTLNN